MGTLVHIGWPKTATTWLQENVFVAKMGYEQPLSREEVIRKIVLPDQLEFDHIAVEATLGQRLRETADRGFLPVISHERLSGILKNRLESIVFADRLIDTIPDMKVLIVVREQRDAMLASWQQYLRNGGDPSSGPAIKSLRSYYGDERTRSSALPPIGDLKYFEYNRLARYYVDALGQENVLILPLEMLRLDPDLFLESINRFSGSASTTVPNENMTNKAWAPASYAIKRRLNYIGHRDAITTRSMKRYNLVMAATYRFDRLLPSQVRARGNSTNIRTVQEIAGDRFVTPNRLLSDMVAWELEPYGYPV